MKLLNRTTSAGVIHALKSIFAVPGIPELVISDNGPQFASEELKNFSISYSFNHVTSSPKYPASNGEAERTVRTEKEIFKKSKSDPYLALLTYLSTPLQNGLSPSELLMGRKLRTQLPILSENLEQTVQDEQLQGAEKKEEHYRMKQAMKFDDRHKTKLLPQLQRGDNV